MEVRVGKQPSHRGALVRIDRREHLEHFSSEPGFEADRPRSFGEALELGGRGRLVLGAAVVKRDGETLAFRVVPPGLVRERVDAGPPDLCARVELESVRPDAHDAVDAEASAHVVAGAARDDRDEGVAVREALQLLPRLGRRVRVLRTRDDRREHAVEVEEQPRALRLGREALEQRSPRCHGL
jgi:hypothetical protein